MSQSQPDHDLKALEQSVLDAALPLIPELGFSFTALKAAARSRNLSDGARDMAFPNGARDLAALLWRRFDDALEAPEVKGGLSNLKIREKIARLINARLEAFAADEAVAHRLTGFLALPHNLPLYQRLVWGSADRIWRMAGDTATDENHHSKRLILEGILTTAALTRLTRGQDAMRRQIDDNIEAVMTFEKFKAKVPFKPDAALLDAVGLLGKLRFGKAPSPVKEMN